jgi:hypothetical protein
LVLILDTYINIKLWAINIKINNIICIATNSLVRLSKFTLSYEALTFLTAVKKTQKQDARVFISFSQIKVKYNRAMLKRYKALRFPYTRIEYCHDIFSSEDGTKQVMLISFKQNSF